MHSEIESEELDRKIRCENAFENHFVQKLYVALTEASSVSH